MDGILKLNHCHIDGNVPFGAHDPSMMWDPVTKRYYSYSTDVYMPARGLNQKIGIPVRVSKDLITFTYRGTVLSKKAIQEGRDNTPYPPTKEFWAPYVEYVCGEYRMYYSATRAFGSSESRIWLATARNPLGPFENRGVVMNTWGTDDTFPNAIDAHVIWQGETPWLVYGSFFGGIYLKRLRAEDGLAADGERALGTCISRAAPRGVIDGPEGASLMYERESGYYYLFQSYGWLGDTYDIRVARSKNVTGPYLDFHGRDVKGQAMGMKLAGSYQFRAKHPNADSSGDGRWQWGGFRGPGHGVPFYDPKRGRYFFVHHVRDGAKMYRTHDRKEDRDSYSMHYLMIRPMFFVDGWPVLSPEVFTGEKIEEIPKEKGVGTWEWIIFDEKCNRQKESTEKILDLQSEELKHGILHRTWDFENAAMSLAISGYSKSGLAYWGKFLYN